MVRSRLREYLHEVTFFQATFKNNTMVKPRPHAKKRSRRLHTLRATKGLTCKLFCTTCSVKLSKSEPSTLLAASVAPIAAASFDSLVMLSQDAYSKLRSGRKRRYLADCTVAEATLFLPKCKKSEPPTVGLGLAVHMSFGGHRGQEPNFSPSKISASPHGTSIYGDGEA